MKSRVFKPPQGEVSKQDVLDVINSQKDIPNGVAGLDSDGLIKLTELKNIDFDNLSSDVVDRINLTFIFSL